MLEYHKAKNADATIAVLDVPKEEASRFGIMITDEDDNIIDFEEKPKNPRSTLASMGIYIFTWKKLKAYLIANENDKEASKDFGKNILRVISVYKSDILINSVCSTRIPISA